MAGHLDYLASELRAEAARLERGDLDDDMTEAGPAADACRRLGVRILRDLADRLDRIVAER